MAKHNAANERIKRRYFAYLTGAHGRDQATVDAVAKSLARFEDYTRARDFAKFRREQAMGFRDRLAEQRNARTGEQLARRLCIPPCAIYAHSFSGWPTSRASNHGFSTAMPTIST